MLFRSRGISTGPNITNPNFSNIAYGGLGIHFNHHKGDNILHINPNIILFAMPKKIKFGYDPTVHDIFTTYLLKKGSVNYDRFINSYDKTLSSNLGVEINAQVDFEASDSLKFYAGFGIFLPGSYYNDIKNYSYQKEGKNIPLKNQLSISKYDVTGAESTERYRVTLLDNASYYFNLGVSFNFDVELFGRRRKNRK